jgi:23S rRNA (uracil1939-C5)-methyltransferase
LLKRYRAEGRKWPGTHEQAVAALDSSRPRAAVLYPPREGLAGDAHEIVCAIEALGVSQVIAVGCDPDSWARDVAKFVRRGWTLERVATLDLFPQTPHVESIGVLRV